MIALALPYPPSINHYWRHQGGRHHISNEGKVFRANVMAEASQARSQRLGGPLSGRLAVSIEATMPDRRRRDLDNIVKPLLDALTHAGLWLDDDQIDALRIVRMGTEPPGAVVVRVEPYQPTRARR